MRQRIKTEFSNIDWSDLSHGRPVRSRFYRFSNGVAPMRTADKVLVGVYFFIVFAVVLLIVTHRVPPHHFGVSLAAVPRSIGYIFSTSVFSETNQPANSTKVTIGIVVPPSTVAHNIVDWVKGNPMFPLANTKDLTIVSDLHAILCGVHRFHFDIGVFVRPHDPMVRFYRHVVSSRHSLETVLEDIDRDLECVQHWDRHDEDPQSHHNREIDLSVCKHAYCSIQRRRDRPHFLLWGMHGALSKEFLRSRMPETANFVRMEEGASASTLAPLILGKIDGDGKKNIEQSALSTDQVIASFGSRTRTEPTPIHTPTYEEMVARLRDVGLPLSLIEGIRDFYSMHAHTDA